MNRILPLLLCCLILCGCAANPPVESDPLPVLPSEAPQVSPTSPPQSEGSLQTFSLGVPDALGLFAMGETLLVLSGTESTTLTLLSGDHCAASASVTLPFLLEPSDPSLRLGDGQLSYFDPVSRQTVVLDGALREVSHIPAPEELQGVPILSGDRNTLYYCTAQGLHSWNLEAGLHRQITQMAFPDQALSGLSMDDTVLMCTVTEKDLHRSLLFSTQTGALLHSETGDISLSQQNGHYCLSLPAGLGQIFLWGEPQAAPNLFLPEDAGSTCFFLSNRGGAITHSSREENRLDYYDLQTGLRCSSLTLSANLTPLSAADTPEGRLYLLVRNETTQSSLLLRWEIDPSNDLAVQDDTCCLFPYEASGHELSAQCHAFASQLSQKYGISILVGEDAVRVQSWDYDLCPETQSGIVLRELENLETRLSIFPQGFLSDTAPHFTSLNLCIVRSITGTAESGNLAQATGATFLDGTDAYVVITAGQYGEQALYRELFLAMETHIMTGSGAFDAWNKLNPQGFSYTLGAADALSDPDSLLTGENRAFLDAYAMTFPREDRSRVFAASLLPGNQETFRPWILQRKLIAVCQGIREAYDLTQSKEAYPWEQYLDVPLAYRE